MHGEVCKSKAGKVLDPGQATQTVQLCLDIKCYLRGLDALAQPIAALMVKDMHILAAERSQLGPGDDALTRLTS